MSGSKEKNTKRVMLSLLELTNHFPHDKQKIWVTSAEIRDRLVHAGVHISLDVGIITNALNRFNKNETYMLKHREGNEWYFRPLSFASDTDVPKFQRAQRVVILPERDFLKKSQAAEELKSVNEWLLEHSVSVAHAKKEENQRSRVVTPCQSLENHVAEAGEKISFSAQFDSDNQSEAEIDYQSETEDDGAIENNGIEYNYLPARFSDVDNNDGNGIFNLQMLNNFVHEVSSHAANCGAAPNLRKVDKHYGASIIETWVCPCCAKELNLFNCKWIKSLPERGRRHARLQLDLNVRIPKGARTNGIGGDAIRGLLSASLGIKIANKRNYLHAERKIRSTIDELYEARKEENLAKHVQQCKALGYKEMEFEINGIKSSAICGPIAMDGTGSRHAHGHKITGDETAHIVQSGVVPVPLSLVHSQVKFIIQCLAYLRSSHTIR